MERVLSMVDVAGAYLRAAVQMLHTHKDQWVLALSPIAVLALIGIASLSIGSIAYQEQFGHLTDRVQWLLGGGAFVELCVVYRLLEHLRRATDGE